LEQYKKTKKVIVMDVPLLFESGLDIFAEQIIVVKAKKNEVWGGISHYVVRIDATPPAGFTPTIEPSPRTAERQPLVSFITTLFICERGISLITKPRITTAND